MIKGHVFAEQLFEDEAFAAFIDTFLNKTNGIIRDVKEGCSIAYNENTITVSSGFFCVRGRFLEIADSERITLDNTNAYCRLVCEIDLSKENTEDQFNQAYFKIIKGTNDFQALRQDNIINGTGIYQLEFAQFQTNANGIISSTYKDKRTYLDINSIYTEIRNKFNVLSEEKKAEVENIINELRKEISNVEDGSAFILKDKIRIGTGAPSLDLGNEGDIYFQVFD